MAYIHRPPHTAHTRARKLVVGKKVIEGWWLGKLGENLGIFPKPGNALKCVKT